jgi:hypothetical protein
VSRPARNPQRPGSSTSSSSTLTPLCALSAGLVLFVVRPPSASEETSKHAAQVRNSLQRLISSFLRTIHVLGYRGNQVAHSVLLGLHRCSSRNTCSCAVSSDTVTAYVLWALLVYVWTAHRHALQGRHSDCSSDGLLFCSEASLLAS